MQNRSVLWGKDGVNLGLGAVTVRFKTIVRIIVAMTVRGRKATMSQMGSAKRCRHRAGPAGCIATVFTSYAPSEGYRPPQDDIGISITSASVAELTLADCVANLATTVGTTVLRYYRGVYGYA